MSVRWLAMVALLAACGTQRFNDTGRACLSDAVVMDGEVGTIDLAAGEVATITVVLDPCVMGSVRVRSSRCRIGVGADGVIDVSARVVADVAETPSSECTEVAVECEFAGLAAGSYTLTYRGDETTFDVPYSGPALCVGA